MLLARAFGGRFLGSFSQGRPETTSPPFEMLMILRMDSLMKCFLEISVEQFWSPLR
jgi:hypothetical protein